jgi:Short-chain dehydrogenases of various substrate specificities
MADKPIAIVTGVGPGTGSAIVRRFAREGFRVIALARSPDRIRALEQELPDTHAVICDVSSESQVAETVASVRKSYGSPNVLIHNAVGGGWGTFLEIEPAMLERNFRVNAMGLLYLAREVAPDRAKARSSSRATPRPFAARRTLPALPRPRRPRHPVGIDRARSRAARHPRRLCPDRRRDRCAAHARTHA